MKISTIKRVTRKYKSWVEDLAKQADNGISNHFIDIAPQSLAAMSALEQLMGCMGINKEDMHVYIKSMRGLRTYLRLIEKFPDFKNGELMTEKGYFPDIVSSGKAAGRRSGNYTSEAEKRLYAK